MTSQHIGSRRRRARPRSRTRSPGWPPTPTCTASSCQLPLPDGLDPEPVLDLVPPEKDVDGLTERSMGRLLRGRAGHVPCTPKGVMRLLERYGVGDLGRRGPSSSAAHAGRAADDACCSPARASTPRSRSPTRARADLVEVCREADIVIAAAGHGPDDHRRPRQARARRWSTSGVSRTEAGIVGDVDFDAVQAVAGRHHARCPAAPGR